MNMADSDNTTQYSNYDHVLLPHKINPVQLE